MFGEAQHQVFLGRDYADHQDYSEETARRIDTEVQRIMREAHERAERILGERREQLDLMAKVLLERETVEGDAVDALLENTWDEYLAGKEQEGSSAEATPSPATHRRAPPHERGGARCGRCCICSGSCGGRGGCQRFAKRWRVR